MIQFDVIFLVDDDPINNLINKRLLGKVGISDQIIEFLEGEEALTQIEILPSEHQVLIFLFFLEFLFLLEYYFFYLHQEHARWNPILYIDMGHLENELLVFL